MTNVYRGFLQHYRVLTFGRVVLLLIVLAVFGLYAYLAREPEAIDSYFRTFFS
jgi:hypothetical protein